ncbi:MAG: ArnT family glycosyltransferase, partial [Spirochaetota bacterium]
MDKRTWDKENTLLVLLIVFLFFYKFFSFRMFDIGGDAINYWFASKHILYNVSYGELDHQISRFGLILPMWISQVLFGSHPAVTLIFPNLFFILHILLIYKIGVRIKNPETGFIASLLFMLCPLIIRYGSQVVPEAIGGPLVTASFYFLLKYNDTQKNQYLYLTLSAFMLFWAYCAHELNIFFMPGFLISILLFKKNIKDALLYSVILFVLFLCETAIFYYYTGDIMARYHAITGHHFTLEKFTPITFWQLFDRYTKTQLWWRIPFYTYLAVLCLVWKKGNNVIKATIISGFTFFLLMLFAVKSINPIVPALAMKEVHLLFALPFMTFILAIGLQNFYGIIQTRIFKFKNDQAHKKEHLGGYGLLIILLIVLAFIITSSGILPQKIEMYYNNPLNLKEHKLIRFFTYYTIFNNAYNNGIPIISDYILTNEELSIYARVQELRSKGKNLDEALELLHFPKERYIYIRPNMPVKSLNAVRKIFL